MLLHGRVLRLLKILALLGIPMLSFGSGIYNPGTGSGGGGAGSSTATVVAGSGLSQSISGSTITLSINFGSTNTWTAAQILSSATITTQLNLGSYGSSNRDTNTPLTLVTRHEPATPSAAQGLYVEYNRFIGGGNAAAGINMSAIRGLCVSTSTGVNILADCTGVHGQAIDAFDDLDGVLEGVQSYVQGRGIALHYMGSYNRAKWASARVAGTTSTITGGYFEVSVSSSDFTTARATGTKRTIWLGQGVGGGAPGQSHSIYDEELDPSYFRGYVGFGTKLPAYSVDVQDPVGARVLYGLTFGTATGNGAAITNLNGSNIASGQVSSTVLPSTISYTTKNETISGFKTFTASSVTINSAQNVQLMMNSSFARGPLSGSFIQITQNDGNGVVAGDRLGGFVFSGLTSTPGTIGNGAGILSYATGTYTASSFPTKMTFEAAAPGATTRTQVVSIFHYGVGIGTGVPQDTLDVRGNERISGRIWISSNSIMPGTTVYADGTMAATRIVWPDGTVQVSSPSAGGGSGDITDVIAGTGLSGGGTSGAVTLNIVSTNSYSTNDETITGVKTFTSSITVGGAGDGEVSLTIGNSTYTVTYTSAPQTVGYAAVWLSTSGALGSAPLGGGGSGDITDVIAGTGLTGGAASGAATLAVSSTQTFLNVTVTSNTIVRGTTFYADGTAVISASTQTASGVFFDYTSSTMTVSSATVSGQLRVGTLQGASLSACGDSTHALSWSGGNFGCQAISAGGGGSSSLAIATGTLNGFASPVSSPTEAINFSSNAFTASLAGGATAFINLNFSSVTAMGGTFNGVNQLVKLDGSGNLPALNGSALTNLNGSNVNSGQISSTVLPSTISYTTKAETLTGGKTLTSSMTVLSSVFISTSIDASGQGIVFNSPLKSAYSITKTSNSVLSAGFFSCTNNDTDALFAGQAGHVPCVFGLFQDLPTSNNIGYGLEGRTNGTGLNVSEMAGVLGLGTHSGAYNGVLSGVIVRTEKYAQDGVTPLSSGTLRQLWIKDPVGSGIDAGRSHSLYNESTKPSYSSASFIVGGDTIPITDAVIYTNARNTSGTFPSIVHRSGVSGRYFWMGLGHTSTLASIVVPASNNAFMTGTQSGDLGLRADGSTNKVVIGAGSGQGTLYVNQGSATVNGSMAVTSSMTITGTSQLILSSTTLKLSTMTITRQTEEGELYTGSVQKALVAKVGGATQTLSGVIFTLTASSANFNSATAVDMLGSGVNGDGVSTTGIKFPANFWTPGKTVYVMMSGTFTTTSTPALVSSVTLGGTLIVSTNNVQNVATGGPAYWELTLTLTCRTTGASGVVWGNGQMKLVNSRTASTNMSLINQGNTVNTTTELPLAILTKWGTANASNNITANNAFIDVKN